MPSMPVRLAATQLHSHHTKLADCYPPSLARLYAQLSPAMPAPMTTTSALMFCSQAVAQDAVAERRQHVQQVCSSEQRYRQRAAPLTPSVRPPTGAGLKQVCSPTGLFQRRVLDVQALLIPAGLRGQARHLQQQAPVAVPAAGARGIVTGGRLGGIAALPLLCSAAQPSRK